MTPIWILTNDSHLWLLQGFAYLFNKYWSETREVKVFTHNLPPFELPDNFKFIQRTNNYSHTKWTNTLIEMLKVEEDDYLILFLEDYWLTDYVNGRGIEELREYLEMFPQVLRMDLSADRASFDHSRLASYSEFDIIQASTYSKYLMSFQAAIWNKEHLLKILVPGETPWQAELDGTARLRKRPDISVLGTLNRPLKYQPVYRSQQDRKQLDKLDPEDLQYIQRMGWI